MMQRLASLPLSQVCISQVCISQVCVSHVCISQVCISQVCISQVCISQVCVSHVCISQVCISQVCISHVCMAPTSISPSAVLPQVTASPQAITLLAGATAYLSCVATGDPSPLITWSTYSAANILSLGDPRIQVSPIIRHVHWEGITSSQRIWNNSLGCCKGTGKKA